MTDDHDSGQRLDVDNYHFDRVERFDGLSHPRLRGWLAGKQYWLAIILICGLAIVVGIELFTNIDLGLVPDDRHQEEATP